MGKECANCGEKFYRDKRNTYEYWRKAKYCSRNCAGAAIGKHKVAARKSFPDYFWARVEKKGPDECWPWTGPTDRDGYGTFIYGGVNFRANRALLLLFGREAKRGEHAAHMCGNPWCCNPDHVIACSPAENISHKKIHGTENEGERNHFSRLTESQVLLIRADTRSQAEIASDYGVSAGHVVAIQRRKAWKHV